MYPIGTAARISGLSAETIRFYERSGIVPQPRREANGRRVYSDGEIERLSFIRRCRELDFPIAVARALLALSETGEGVCGEVYALASSHLEKTRERIAELQSLEDKLEQMLAHCHPEAKECRALDGLRETC